MRCMVLSLMLLLMIGVVSSDAATRFIAPGGAASDSNDGASRTTPWKTFGMLNTLFAGDTLIVMNGMYTVGANGYGGYGGGANVGFAYCGSGAHSGAEGAPITIIADNERQAHLQGDGYTVFALYRCRYWVIQGLYLRNVQTGHMPGFDGSPLALDGGDHHIIRKNLLYGPNNCFNTHIFEGITIWPEEDQRQTGTLVEENELYFQSVRHGLAIGNGSTWSADQMTIRRNYIHSKNRPMPTDQSCASWSASSIQWDGGGEGISCYPCRNSIIENNIVEQFLTANTMQCRFDCGNNTYSGNISVGNWWGFGFTPRSEDVQNVAGQMPTNELVQDMLIVGQQNGYGVGIGAPKNCNVRNISILDNDQGGGTGYRLDDCSQGSCGDGVAYGYWSNTLMVGGSTGFASINLSDWSLQNSMYYGGNLYFDPPLGDPHYSNIYTNTDPNLGPCKVFIPNSSPAKGAGVGGADIGATLLYQYHNGVIPANPVPLWDPNTSRFSGCGVVVAGANDDESNSCIGVHKRLNVNWNGCTLPTSTTIVQSVGPFFIANPPTGQAGRTCDEAKVEATPMSTLAEVLPCGLPGATFVFLNGVYTDPANFINMQASPVPSGTASTPTIIKAKNNKGATLRLTAGYQRAVDFNASTSAYVTLDGLVLDGNGQVNTFGLNMFTSSNHLRFINGEIKGFTFAGAYIIDCNTCEVSSSLIHDNAAPGISLGGNSNMLLALNQIYSNNSGIDMRYADPGFVEQHLEITRSLIRNNTNVGVQFIGVSGAGGSSLVANSIIHSNGAQGLHLSGGSDSVQVLNNTFWNNPVVGVQIDAVSANILVANNIFWQNTGGALTGAATQDKNTIGDPVFAAPGPPTSFHPTTALTIDQGNTYPRVAVDYDGTARTAPYTIGAEEETTVIPPPVVRKSPYAASNFFVFP
jgi:Right handed beta helix region